MMGEERTNALLAFSFALQGLVLGVVLIFPSILSVDLPGFYFGLTFLPVAAIFYWPSNASYSWSLLAIFLVGLFYDLASAGPLGVWALSFLVLYIVLGGRAVVRSGLAGHFAGFSLCVICVFLLVVLFGRLALGHWPQIFNLLINGLATIAVFPLIYWLRTTFIMMRGTQRHVGLKGRAD